MAWLLAGFACSSAAAEELQPVRTLAGISEYRLANGLQVLLMPVSGAGRTFVTVTYKVGSRMEGEHETGMAHLLEHVTFHGATDAQGQLLDLGAEVRRLSPGANGQTSYDSTNYTENFLPDADALARVLRLEAARMHGARLAQEDFEKEKPIVLNEMGLRGAGLPRQLLEALAAGAFSHHPYGRPVIGTTADIEHLSLATLRGFYEKFYRPDNAVLMIAGEFDVQPTLAAVQASFGAIAQPAGAVPEAQFEEAPQTEPRVVVIHTEQTGAAVAYRVPSLADPQAAALLVWSTVLPSVRNDLLLDAANRAGLIRFWMPTREPFLVGVGASLPKVKSDTADARKRLASDVESWAEVLERAEFGSRADERRLVVAIESARSSWSQALRTPGPASAMVSQAVGAGDWRLAVKMLDELEHLNAAQVAAAADTYARARNRTIVLGVTDPAVTGTQVQERPLSGFSSWFSKPVQMQEHADVGAAVADIHAAEASQAATGGAAFETDAAELDRRVQRVALPSGIRVAAIQRQTANERVTVILQLRWGAAQAMAGETGWRALGPELLGAGTHGATPLSRDQLDYLKAKVQAQIGISPGPQGVKVVVAAPRANLQTALLLVRDMLRDPDLPGDAFKELQARTLARLAADTHELDWAPELAREHRVRAQGLQWGDARYAYSVREQAEQWRKLDIDAVRSFAKRYWSANDLRVSAVGPLPKTFAALIEADFGDWKKPSVQPFERSALNFRPEDGARFVSHRKAPADAADEAHASAQVRLAQGFALNARDTDAMAMRVGAFILAGGATTGSRLADRLRGKDATSYSVRYTLTVPPFGNAASLSLDATASPTQALRVEAAVREELARLLKDGITQAELDNARREARVALRRDLSDDGALAASLMTQFDQPEGFAASQARQAAAVDALTVDSVNAALRRLLLPEHWIATLTGVAAESEAR